MAEETKPTPKVFHPHFIVHHDGHPVVMNATFVALVGAIRPDDASRAPAWAKTSIEIVNGRVFCSESFEEVCRLMTPDWRLDPPEAKET